MPAWPVMFIARNTAALAPKPIDPHRRTLPITLHTALLIFVRVADITG